MLRQNDKMGAFMVNTSLLWEITVIIPKFQFPSCGTQDAVIKFMHVDDFGNEERSTD